MTNRVERSAPTHDPYAPAEIAQQVERLGVTKAGLPFFQTFVLGLLAGAFIALGAMFSTLVMTGSPFGFGPTRLLGGIVFSLGLILTLLGGAELFTGNNLIVMAWAEGRISLRQLARNWAIVFVANLVGAVGAAMLVHWSGTLGLGDGAVGETAARIARAKVELDAIQALIRGILCNALVCLAVWLCVGARSASARILAIVFPISAFVALGFEHSIANMYLIPAALLQGAAGVTIGGFIANLVPVTLGNIVGGSGFVALVYRLVYLRRPGPGWRHRRKDPR